MSKFVTKAGTGHGPRSDENYRAANGATGHGAQFDDFSRQARHNHGPQSDEGYRKGAASGADEQFERQLAAAPDSVKKLPASCPACGHSHTLVDALRAAHRRVTGKARRSAVDVQKTDDPFIRDGAGEPDDLHEALVASIRRTYGYR